jgi:hypothetical protein
MNSVTSDTSLSGFLSQGIGPLIQSRILGLVSAVQIYFVIAIPIVLAPFALIGGWARRRSVDFGPFFVYAVLLFAASGLLFAVHVPYGTFLHSAVAMVPFTFILVFEGTVIAARWAARHRPSWTEEGATRLFLVAARPPSRSTPAPSRRWEYRPGMPIGTTCWPPVTPWTLRAAPNVGSRAQRRSGRHRVLHRARRRRSRPTTRSR